MKNAVFAKRLFAAVVDHVLVSIVIFTMCSSVTTTLFADTINQQMAPFVVIQLLINPLPLLISIFTNPQAYGNTTAVYTLFTIDLCAEVIYYSSFELLPIKRTPGYMAAKISICYEKNHRIGVRIVIRNVLKVFSRYAYCLPFVVLMFEKNGMTFYDRVTKVCVKGTVLED